MPDQKIMQCLEVMDHALALITSRFEKIEAQETFVLSDYNLILLDSIAMRLQNVAEKIKVIERHSPGYWNKLGIDAQPIIRFRDFISHHYEDMEYEILMDVCRNDLPNLTQKVKTLLADH